MSSGRKDRPLLNREVASGYLNELGFYFDHEDMAKFLDCDRSSISYWELKKSTPNKERLTKLARLHNTVTFLKEELSFDAEEVAVFLRDERLDRDTYQPLTMINHIKDGFTSLVVQNAIELCIDDTLSS